MVDKHEERLSLIYKQAKIKICLFPIILKFLICHVVEDMENWENTVDEILKGIFGTFKKNFYQN